MVAVYGSAKGPKKVAILPFTMNADRDLTFLQEGIIDMFATRLAWKGEVEILEKGQVKREAEKVGGPLNREKALQVGKSLGAEYVILGSLTVFGESVSIDARILDVVKSEELITAFNESKGMDEVIPTVTRFAQDINEKIMGRVAARQVAPTGMPEAPAGPGGLIMPGGGFEGKGVSFSMTLPMEVIGMDTGDVDGDGKDEVVFINKDTVYVYKWVNNTLAQIKTHKKKWSTNHIYVSVMDTDRNGRAEIFVTNLGDSDANSYVLEWDGDQFKEIADGQPWLFRVFDLPGKGKTLIGQERRTGGSYSGDVRILNREGNHYVPAGTLPLPRFGNIYNFALAPFESSGQNYTVMLDPDEYLRLYNPGNEMIWKSSDYYGGTLNAIKTVIFGGEGTQQTEYSYIPSPIYLTDVDEDGQKEVMVCENHSKIGRLLAQFRYFSDGAVHFLTFDKAGLNVKWTTRKQPGAIVGYRIADIDYDGLPELVIVSVLREEHMMGRPSSKLVVFDLK